ncbi:uncharacterized protein LOC113941584 [Corapipo altera]|uniref:uncharacterized protein LOC113941584 n=1 Tax=Corapipo altera TaxID=415028 RepID=UPI000FD675DE|nr:uncharacterized protein LOC113941584 [Corapipo altera]
MGRDAPDPKNPQYRHPGILQPYGDPPVSCCDPGDPQYWHLRILQPYKDPPVSRWDPGDPQPSQGSGDPPALPGPQEPPCRRGPRVGAVPGSGRAGRRELRRVRTGHAWGWERERHRDPRATPGAANRERDPRATPGAGNRERERDPRATPGAGNRHRERDRDPRAAPGVSSGAPAPAPGPAPGPPGHAWGSCEPDTGTDPAGDAEPSGGFPTGKSFCECRHRPGLSRLRRGHPAPSWAETGHSSSQGWAEGVWGAWDPPPHTQSGELGRLQPEGPAGRTARSRESSRSQWPEPGERPEPVAGASGRSPSLGTRT